MPVFAIIPTAPAQGLVGVAASASQHDLRLIAV